MKNKTLELEIQKRLESELWEKRITKKVHNKLIYDYILKYKKIAMIIIFTATSIISYKIYNFYKFHEQNELLTNLYFEYNYPIYLEYITYQEK